MKIEIDLNDLGFQYDVDGDPVGRGTITDAIIDATAARLASALVREVDVTVKDRVQELVDAKVLETVGQVFAEPIQRVHPWGDKNGTPVTIKELIRESVEGFLKAPASRDRYGSNSPRNLTELIEEATRNILGGDLKQTITQVRAEIKNTVTEKAIRAAAEALAK